MDCNEIAKAEALANPRMSFIWNAVVDSFEGTDRLETVILRNLKTEERIPVPVDSCFLFIGYLPNTELFQGVLQMNKGGYLQTNERMETNLPGVWAVGDVREKFLKQVATAVGDGAVAGYGVEKYLAESEVFHNQILNGGKPSLVYLYNGSSASDREMLPVLEGLENQHPNLPTIHRVDIYKSDGLARRLGVSQIPSVVYVKEEKVQKVLPAPVDGASILALSETEGA